MRDDLHHQLMSHLIRNDDQEDLCFGTYVPSTGNSRFTGIISNIILPLENERLLHGNVGFLPEYFERVMDIALQQNKGIVFLHSHLGPGWQGMSRDDIICETRISPAVYSATGLPPLGMTLGIDGAWSARFWKKDTAQKRKYDRYWCESVRIIGYGLSITFNDNLNKPRFDSKKQLRTISAWGQDAQEDLSRLRIGIVGLGSVGSIVAEILARTGISYFTLIDFDTVEEKNLDRLTNVHSKDIGRSKVTAIHDGIKRSSTSSNVDIICCEYSICEEQGFKLALDCDILFCCVDRPWPRQVLNFIAYNHLIPVIDGGILVRTNKKNNNLIGADWKAQTVGYKRPCLECLGQYKTENAILEKDGFIDDPQYIQGLDNPSLFDYHENVFVFSSHLASLEVLQMLSLFISPSGVSCVGQQMHHFVTGTMDSENQKKCNSKCFFESTIGKGDHSNVTVFGKHQVAENARTTRALLTSPDNQSITSWMMKKLMRVKHYIQKYF
jgi:molybdopterin/thiamine biosynthesis adenylyltransferase